ncbi:unnamed protein product [Mytilus coruscus]|uniref:Reverse transcriptase domain-containing protein n=1 Tax=Mytilus coruscus TaxID=42192 RepID=A0A6J8EPC5_MYTCO|nr:unnamed protein product [Mytilus coruscus]
MNDLDKSQMSDVDKVFKWAEAKKLSEATASTLLQLGFDSLEALALLTQDDLSKSKLPIGQQKLLIKSVRQTFLQSEEENDGDLPKRTRTNNGLPAPTEPEVTDNYIREVLGQLQKQQPQHGGHVSNCSTNNTGSSLNSNDNISWQDPQIYLKSLNSSGSSVVYYDIVDFVQSSGGFFDEEKLISKSDCGQLVFKSGPSKPKLETVTMCQWSMANLAILHKLLGEVLLDHGQVLDYLSYTTRIYQLITSHDMVSVFFYDREYRRLQSMHRFRWDTDIPHIQMVYLKPRAARYSQQTNTQPKGSGASTRGGGAEIMRPIPPVAKRFVGSLTLDMAALLPLPSEFKSKKLGNTVKPLRALDLHVWSQELANDFDREFLLNGIEFGFDIIDCDQLPSSIISKNHPSASPNNPLYEKAHTQVLYEIECGNYKFTSSDPCIISPIGVIPKQDGGIRLIHDCSRPKGSSVNSLVSEIEKQRFQTLDDVAKLVTKNCCMSKVDLKSAYRSVKLSQRSQKVTGFNWTLYDTKLLFGSKLAPCIFHRLTQAVRRMMSRRGFTIVAYLDDFFLCEQSEFRCRQALNSLIFLLRELGFMINWQKVVDPTTKLTFLGVEIDSIAMELRLPGDKLSLLKQELTDFGNRKRASKKQLQSLSGKLNWASTVVHDGRVFLRRIIDSITQLQHDWHKILIKGDIMQDILWWQNFISTFNGKSLILDKYPVTSVYTDACPEGGGGHFGSDWFYAKWDADFAFTKDLHINELEALSVVLAAIRRGKTWQNKKVIVYSDNMATRKKDIARQVNDHREQIMQSISSKIQQLEDTSIVQINKDRVKINDNYIKLKDKVKTVITKCTDYLSNQMGDLKHQMQSNRNEK